MQDTSIDDAERDFGTQVGVQVGAREDGDYGAVGGAVSECQFWGQDMNQ